LDGASFCGNHFRKGSQNHVNSSLVFASELTSKLH
jgi:hypothetical protein